jgi:Gas vesicle protein G
MLLIDDLLAAPLRGLFFVLKEVNAAVQAEQAADERQIIAELAELHRKLDTSQITEADFDVSEERLLQRLGTLRGEGGANAGDHDDG